MTVNYDAPHTVYLHRDRQGRVIYVGCTQNLEQRTKAHRDRALWRAQIAFVEVDSVQPDYHRGRAREAALIRKYEPRNNRLSNPAVERERDAWQALAWRFGGQAASEMERSAGGASAALELIERKEGAA